MRDGALVSVAEDHSAYRRGAGNSPSAAELLKVAAERADLHVGLEGSVFADPGALTVATFDGRPSGDTSGLSIQDRIA